MELTDVIISTRLSLKRNLANYNFAISLSEKKAVEIYLYVKNAIEKIHFALGGDFIFEVHQLAKLDFLELKKLQAEGIIAPNLPMHEGRGIARCKKCYILINVDDHITIGTVTGIYSLEENLNILYAVESALGQQVPYAFDERFGFLTSSINYFGSGFAVTFLSSFYFLVHGEKYIKKLAENFGNLFTLVTVDMGLENEKSKFLFHVITLHAHCETPEKQLREIFSLLDRIVKIETNDRKRFLEQKYDEAYDFVLRAFLIAKHSIIVPEYELYDLLAALRFGVYAKIITDIRLEIIDELVVQLRTPFLVEQILEEAKISMQDITIKMVDKKRAEILNAALLPAKIGGYTK